MRAIGEELFDEFAVSYLQRHPSRSYTLNQLGADFARFLRETCPSHAGAGAADQGWPLFLVDLATLEWTFSEVFDGPGIERTSPLTADALRQVPAERWPQARSPAPCLRLLVLSYPVHAYYRALRDDAAATPPEPRTTYLAVSRRDYVVRYLELSQSEHVLLKALINGESLGDAFQAWDDSAPAAGARRQQKTRRHRSKAGSGVGPPNVSSRPFSWTEE